MPDILQIGTGLMELAGGIANAEDKMKLSQAAMALNELASENKRLMDENASLRIELDRRKDLEYVGGCYYLTGKDGEMIGALCPGCYKESGFIYLLGKANGGARCSVCGKTYYGAKPAVGGYRQMVI
jgi:hypothetical protein